MMGLWVRARRVMRPLATRMAEVMPLDTNAVEVETTRGELDIAITTQQRFTT